MKQVTRWILLSMCGWLGIVKSNQLPHTACQTLDHIFRYKLNIKCNTDEIVYVINQLSVNSLGTHYGYIAEKDTECHNTGSSKCFRTITSDLSSAYTSKITLFCNEKHNCTLEFSDFISSVRIFTTSCGCCTDHLYRIRVGVSFECLPSKSQVHARRNIIETRDGFLYLTSNESGRCLIRGFIDSARILEQTNIRFSVSGRKSHLCAEVLTNGSFNYNKDLSCLRGLDVFILEIQTMDSFQRKLWMEFKGASLLLDCRSNIQDLEQNGGSDSEQSGGSALLPIIIGLVAGLLLLLALILVVLKRKHALTIKAEAKHRNIIATTTLEGDQDCTYYNNDVDKPLNDADESFYNTVDTGGDYSQINIKKNTSESGRRNGEQNVKNGTDDTEKLRDESRDTNNVTPRSSKTTENKPNTIIGEVTGDVYAAVCKTDDLKSMRITGPKGDIYTTVLMASDVE